MQSTKDPLIFLFKIAGVQFKKKQVEDAILHGIAEGEDLTLICEPENPYDPTAVRIEWQGYHIGYVPKKEGEELKRLMHGECEGYKAKLSIFNPDTDLWRMFTVLVEV